MDKTRQALKLAQDLRALADRFSEGWHEGIKIDASDIMLLTDSAEALTEQPAQQQEPVAWVCEAYSSDEKHAIDYWPGDVDDLPIGTKLYTSPQLSKPCCVNRAAGTSCLADPHPTCPLLAAPQPSKPWVGLTDEEVHALWMTGEANISENHHSVVAYEVEAKLREKNA